ncbi:hypothetical protein RYX36_006399 [Vicia faba]
MKTTSNARGDDLKPLRLLDVVLSWPLEDVLNENLYKDKEVVSSQQLKLPKAPKEFKQFRYIIQLKSTTDTGENGENYEPGSGDLIVFTNIRPKSLDDLNTLKRPYHIAYVEDDKKLARAIGYVLFEHNLLEEPESPFKKLSLGGNSETATTYYRCVEPI